jgi:hypothetical protein
MIRSSEKIHPFFFGTRSKVIIMVFLALKNFRSSAKFVRTNFGTRSKVFIMQNNAFKTFDLVPKLEVIILAQDQKFLD